MDTGKLLLLWNQEHDLAMDNMRQLDDARRHIARVGIALHVECPPQLPGESVEQSWKNWMAAIEAKLSANDRADGQA